MSSISLFTSDAYDYQDAKTAVYGTQIGSENQNVTSVVPSSGARDGLVAGQSMTFQSNIQTSTSTPFHRLIIEAVDVSVLGNIATLADVDTARFNVGNRLGLRAGCLGNLYGQAKDTFGKSGVVVSEDVSETLPVKLAITDAKLLNTIMGGAGRLTEYTVNSAADISNPVANNASSIDPENSRGFDTSNEASIINVVDDPASPGTRMLVRVRYALDEACTGGISAMVLNKKTPADLYEPGTWNLEFNLREPIGALFEAAYELVEANGVGTGAIIRPITSPCTHELVFRTSVPSVYVPRPPQMAWHRPSWSTIQNFTTNVANPTPGQPVSVVLTNVNTATVPTLYCLFTRLVVPRTLASPNAQYTIADNLEIRPNGMAPCLQSLRLKDLYNMSVRNGLRYSYSAFRGAVRAFDNEGDILGVGVGSMIFFKPSDLNVPTQYSSNARLPFNLAGTYRSRLPLDVPTGSPLTLETRLFALEDFLLTGDLDASDTTRFVDSRISLAPGDILATAAGDGISFRDVDLSSQRVGGNWFSDIFQSGKKGLSKVVDWFSSPQGKDTVRMLRNLPGLDQFAGDGTALGTIAGAFGAGTTSTGGSVTAMGGKTWSPSDIAKHAMA